MGWELKRWWRSGEHSDVQGRERMVPTEGTKCPGP